VQQRIALTLPNPRGIAETLAQAEWGEAVGYDDLWFTDSSGIDSLTTVGVVAGRTGRV